MIFIILLFHFLQSLRKIKNSAFFSVNNEINIGNSTELVITNTKNNNNNKIFKYKKKIIKKDKSGYDLRNGNNLLNNDDEKNTMYKIMENNYKMNLLKKLSDSKISEIDKIKMINDYNYYKESSKYISNFENGGLYDFWEKNFF